MLILGDWWYIAFLIWEMLGYQFIPNPLHSHYLIQTMWFVLFLYVVIIPIFLLLTLLKLGRRLWIPLQPLKKRAERRRNELPDDLIIGILARLPVKSLLRFRSVSEHWYSLIVSRNFVTIHSTRSHREKKAYLLFYSCKRIDYRRRELARPIKTTASFGFGDVTESLTFWFDMTTVQIVGCSNGVVYLYLWSDPKRKYALWNPATRQVREIGTPPLHDMTQPAPIRSRLRVCAHSGSSETRSIYGSGFYLDPVTNAIKVVYCILNLTVKGETTVQVNVFSTATNSWTENENITFPYHILLKRPFRIPQATCVNVYIHWLDVEDMYILSYDMNEEVFKRIEVPVRPDIGFHRLGCYEGSLAMFVHRGDGSYGSYDEIDVWVLNNCGGTDQSWSKLLTCVPSRKMALAIGFFRKDNADLILFWDSDLSLYSYDTENGETKFLGKKNLGCVPSYTVRAWYHFINPGNGEWKKNDTERAKPEVGNSIV